MIRAAKCERVIIGVHVSCEGVESETHQSEAPSGSGAHRVEHDLQAVVSTLVAVAEERYERGETDHVPAVVHARFEVGEPGHEQVDGALALVGQEVVPDAAKRGRRLRGIGDRAPGYSWPLDGRQQPAVEELELDEDLVRVDGARRVLGWIGAVARRHGGRDDVERV